MNDQLRGLEELSQLILDTELAKLRRLADETRRRQDEIAELGAALARRSAELDGAGAGEDLAFRSGRDAAWLAWVARERGRRVRVAAEAAARREAQHRQAQRAFGQVDALARLRAFDTDERRMQAARRALAEPDLSDRTDQESDSQVRSQTRAAARGTETR